MNFVKKLLILCIFSGAFVSAQGMWKSFSANAAINKKMAVIMATTIAATCASDIISDELRLRALQTPQVKNYLEKNYNDAFNKFVINPLQRKTHYNSMNEAISESALSRRRRGVIAQELIANGIPLNMSNTEACLVCDAANIKQLANGRSKNTSVQKQYIATLEAMFNKEKEAQANGDAVLYHATPPGAYGATYLGTKLEQLFATKVQNDTYLKLRDTTDGVDDKMKGNCITTKDKMLKLLTGEGDDAILRRKLMQCPGHDYKGSLDTVCTATDYNAFFSTYRLSSSDTFMPLEQTASCAGDFWFRNLGKTANLKERISHVLSKFNVSGTLNDQYAKRFYDVIEKFEVQQDGPDRANVMLQIILSKSLLDQTSYTSLCGGLKRDVYKRAESGEVVKLIKTSDYLEQKSKNPFNLVDKGNNNDKGGTKDMEYRLILGNDLLLNQKAVSDQFKVHSYTKHQAHLLEFQKNMNEILKDLERDINKNN